ncbi:hypothetical protein AC579_3272 [Pseudocercospora musae]|uniref:Uncharacterized protein n=1 Tax=Pseudocercospora musae TaxID=113226 RepID=A0A139ID41_9PEZI|nr:hypothetical protein AC579_3272 [Pseudocercospora musae]
MCTNVTCQHVVVAGLGPLVPRLPDRDLPCVRRVAELRHQHQRQHQHQHQHQHQYQHQHQHQHQKSGCMAIGRGWPPLDTSPLRARGQRAVVLSVMKF